MTRAAEGGRAQLSAELSGKGDSIRVVLRSKGATGWRAHSAHGGARGGPALPRFEFGRAQRPALQGIQNQEGLAKAGPPGPISKGRAS